MKITVNNNREKEIIELFSEFITEFIDTHEMTELLTKAGYTFQPHECEVIRQSFWYVKPIVNTKEYPILLGTDNLTGTCKYCNGQWQGIEDESEVTIEEYERFLSLETEESYHAECYREIVCDSCGNDEALNKDELYKSEYGMVCKDCVE